MKKQKLTNEQIIKLKKTKKPPYLIYNVLGGIWKLLFFKKYGVSVKFNYDFRKEKGPYFFFSNHTSRLDYIFVGVPLLPNTYNFVAGHNEFYRSHLKGVFNLLNVIPKKNFTPDSYTLKEISRIIKNNGKIILFPEGMNSIAGMNQPVAIGTGKLVKHFKIPVYYSVISGGYMTTPKYAEDERFGKVEVVFDKLFSAEDIEKLSPEEIEDIINEKLYHDDFAWNAQRKIRYKNDGNIAKNMHHLLFWCPKCNSQFSMVGEKDKIYCTSCKNGATLDDTYTLLPFDENCVIPSTVSAWFNEQRELIKNEVKDPNFSFSAKVKLGVLPQHGPLTDGKTSLIVGEGVAKIDRSGFSFAGTKDGKEYSFFIKSSDVPTYGMCTDMSRFYTFIDGNFVEFYPYEPCVEKFFLATEEIHRLNGGRWQDFKFKK